MTPPNDLEATLDASEAIEFRDKLAGNAEAEQRRPVDIVDASVGESKEALRLLRTRLAAVTFALSIGFSAFALWLTVAQLAGLSDNGWAWTLAEYSLTMFFVGTAIWLRGSSEMSTRCARTIELLVFGLPSLFFAALTARGIVSSVHEFDAIFPITLHGWTILIFAHAIFIPNPWRRAALVSIVIALTPIVAALATTFVDKHTGDVVKEDPSALIEMALGLVATATVAIVGVHTINRLRSEVFEAKQFGRYRLRERLGSGGMGEVYLAEHQLLRRPCAIKMIRPERAGDAKMMARFEREVQATAKLSHWNSIYIYDYGHTADGTLYYVMEYLPGLTLQELVSKAGPLAPSRIIYLMRQVCSALHEAHGLGLIHRDVKPANIFVSERGGQFDVAKLLDFGLVKPLHGLHNGRATEDTVDSPATELTIDGGFAGSPLYMSPEQALGEETPDPRSDIYSLGAVGYFMLTGKPPFSATHAMRVILQHLNDAPTPPSQALDRELNWQIPADLESVILRCMQKDPEQRFRSVCELDAALAACMDADDWDYQRAHQWWHAHCPKLRAAQDPRRASSPVDDRAAIAPCRCSVFCLDSSGS
ncbi:MAG: serine/threonine protein kinase [Pirellulaceae bacterium]|nr:serine/threonine protein kinase [Pirellulaceae bacterium]